MSQAPTTNRITQTKLPEGVLLDKDSWEKIKTYNKWYISKRGDVYSQRTVKNKRTTYKLHRVIMQAPKDMVVDHVNGNKLDNRRCNLRICTQAENSRNCKISKNNTSGCTGVTWDNARQKWLAGIKVNYKNRYLGRFEDKIDAINARLVGEKKYFGQYSPNWRKV